MDGVSGEKENSKHVSSRREDFLRTEKVNRTRQRATRQSLSKVKKVSSKKKVKITKPKVIKKEFSTERKAPTLLAGNRLAKAKKRKRSVIIGFVMLLGLFSSAAVSFLDEGKIDVQKTIEERNDRIRNNLANEDDVITGAVEIPVQNTNINNKPDGGLIGRGVGANNPPSTPEPEVVLASSTATSSLNIASSSETTASSTNIANDEVKKKKKDTDETEEEVSVLE